MEAKALKTRWLATFPEMQQYFVMISKLTENGPCQVGPPILPILRGQLTYSKLANILFQARAAAGVKDAGWLLTKACHDPSSPLYGSRIVAMIHDEYLLETTHDSAGEAMKEIERLAVLGMGSVTPLVPITASAHKMSCWTKA